MCRIQFPQALSRSSCKTVNRESLEDWKKGVPGKKRGEEGNEWSELRERQRMRKEIGMVMGLVYICPYFKQLNFNFNDLRFTCAQKLTYS